MMSIEQVTLGQTMLYKGTRSMMSFATNNNHVQQHLPVGMVEMRNFGPMRQFCFNST